MAVPRGSGSEPRGEGPGPWLWSQAAELRTIDQQGSEILEVYFINKKKSRS